MPAETEAAVEQEIENAADDASAGAGDEDVDGDDGEGVKDREKAVEMEKVRTGGKNYVPPTTGRVWVHPRSVNFHTRAYECPWVSYLQVNQTSKAYLQDCSMASAYALALLGGEGKLTHGGLSFCVDDWINFRPQGAKISVLLTLLRGHFHSLMGYLIAHPEEQRLLASPLLQVLVLLISTNGY
jgi:hypothetical protein